MKLEKSLWDVQSNQIRVSVPILKVDQERRLVHGFATLDNVDRQDDIVYADASLRAFSSFAGNIREMHQPIAVGRMVTFVEDSFYDSESGKFFNGIFVTVYVSKGAASTWEKVLDGTLAGFSIGGEILDEQTEYVPDLGKTVRFIKEYKLIELSLVDSPANQFANIFSIEKSTAGLVFKGMVTETEVSNVFWCSSEKIARSSKSDTLECSICSSNMELIGWFESNENSAEKVQQCVAKFLSLETQELASVKNVVHNENEETSSLFSEGGADVTIEKTVVEKAVEVEEVVAENEVVEIENADTDTVSVDTEEAEVDEVTEGVADEESESIDFAKALDELKVSISEGFQSSGETIEKRIFEITTGFDEKFSTLDQKYTELSEKFESLKAGVDGVEKALSAKVSAIEKSTAVRKSSDLGGSESQEIEKVSNNVWSGAFFSANL